MHSLFSSIYVNLCVHMSLLLILSTQVQHTLTFGVIIRATEEGFQRPLSFLYENQLLLCHYTAISLQFVVSAKSAKNGTTTEALR